MIRIFRDLLALAFISHKKLWCKIALISSAKAIWITFKVRGD